jgi:hypothetical protein
MIATSVLLRNLWSQLSARPFKKNPTFVKESDEDTFDVFQRYPETKSRRPQLKLFRIYETKK